MTKVAAARREKEKTERIRIILSAARKLFLQKGYHNATMRDIAAEAALTTGALYFYFNGKDEIYGRLCEEVLRLHIEVLGDHFPDSGAFADRFSALARAYSSIYTGCRDDFDLLDFPFKKLRVSRELRERLEELTAAALSFPHRVFSDAVSAGDLPPDADPWRLTLAAWAAIEGVLYIHKRDFLENVDFDLEDLISEQVRIFLNGLPRAVVREKE
ncbi:MAG: helix-turn-helix domain-containing protein [Pseudomonadota bacterium]